MLRVVTSLLVLATPFPAAAARASAAPVRVALDLTGLSADDFERVDGTALERRLMVRLVQEGFAVVGPGADAELLAGVHSVPGGIAARVGNEERAIPWGEGDPAELHLEVAQRLAALLRAAAAELVPPEPTAPPPAAPAPESRWRVELGAGVGAMHRGEDPLDLAALVHLGLDLGRAGLDVRALVTDASGAAIDVLEWQVQFGLHLAARPLGYFDVRIGFLAGFLVHEFGFEGESGTRIDPLASLLVSAGGWVADRVGLTLFAAPGWSRTSRAHARDGVTLWQRSALRVEMGVVLVVSL